VREAELQRHIRAELGDLSRYPELWLYPNPAGYASVEHVAYGWGPRGAADLCGSWTRGAYWDGEQRVWPPDARAQNVAIEVKTRTGRLSVEQEQYGVLVRQAGWAYAVIRSVEEARQWAEQMRRKS
jgi:hypothetical protein